MAANQVPVTGHKRQCSIGGAFSRKRQVGRGALRAFKRRSGEMTDRICRPVAHPTNDDRTRFSPWHLDARVAAPACLQNSAAQPNGQSTPTPRRTEGRRRHRAGSENVPRGGWYCAHGHSKTTVHPVVKAWSNWSRLLLSFRREKCRLRHYPAHSTLVLKRFQS
jgi:hypothetical protein